MEKKVYITPSIALIDMKTYSIICGSGTSTEKIDGGTSGNEPNPDDSGIIHGDSKSGITWDEDE